MANVPSERIKIIFFIVQSMFGKCLNHLTKIKQSCTFLTLKFKEINGGSNVNNLEMIRNDCLAGFISAFYKSQVTTQHHTTYFSNKTYTTINEYVSHTVSLPHSSLSHSLHFPTSIPLLSFSHSLLLQLSRSL